MVRKVVMGKIKKHSVKHLIDLFKKVSDCFLNVHKCSDWLKLVLATRRSTGWAVPVHFVAAKDVPRPRSQNTVNCDKPWTILYVMTFVTTLFRKCWSRKRFAKYSFSSNNSDRLLSHQDVVSCDFFCLCDLCLTIFL